MLDVCWSKETTFILQVSRFLSKCKRSMFLLDLKLAFLNGLIKEMVFVPQPPWFVM